MANRTATALTVAATLPLSLLLGLISCGPTSQAQQSQRPVDPGTNLICLYAPDGTTRELPGVLKYSGTGLPFAVSRGHTIWPGAAILSSGPCSAIW